MRACELTIYTVSNVFNFDVVVTTANFEDTLTDALEEGTVTVNTTDGTTLVLSAINVVAIEVGEVREITPPPQKSKLCFNEPHQSLF